MDLLGGRAIQGLIRNIRHGQTALTSWRINTPAGDRHIFGRAVQHITCYLEYLLAYSISRYLHAAAADIGSAGGIRTVVKYAGVGIDRVHDDLVHAHAKRLSGTLTHDAITPLPHLTCAL